MHNLTSVLCLLHFTSSALLDMEKENNKMRYGYDLKNPKERDMYMRQKQQAYQRANDTTKTEQEKYNEIIKERQEEYKYFMEREKQQKNIENDIEKQIEKELPKIIEEKLQEILKGFKM